MLWNITNALPPNSAFDDMAPSAGVALPVPSGVLPPIINGIAPVITTTAPSVKSETYKAMVSIIDKIAMKVNIANVTTS